MVKKKYAPVKSLAGGKAVEPTTKLSSWKNPNVFRDEGGRD
jgi:hypothetical protein